MVGEFTHNVGASTESVRHLILDEMFEIYKRMDQRVHGLNMSPTVSGTSAESLREMASKTPLLLSGASLCFRIQLKRS